MGEGEGGRGGGKIVSSHGSTQTTPDKNGRFLVAEVTVDGKKVVCINIYAPNEPKYRAQFFREISNSFLKMYANENIVLAGDTNCAINRHCLRKPGRGERWGSADFLQTFTI